MKPSPRSPLTWTGAAGIILFLACSGGERSFDGGSSGWGNDDSETEPIPPQATEDTGSEEPDDVEDTAATDTAELVDTAMEDTCDETTPVVLYMSPDDSNSMSSASQVRAAVLEDWAQLGWVTLRGWEFMNYYSFDYEPAAPGELALDMELVPAPDSDGERWQLQIAVTSEALENEDRAPMNLTFVLDTSGSMSGEPLALSGEVLRASAARLREGDVVSVVTWNTSNNVILDKHAWEGPMDLSLHAAAATLDAEGATDLYAGLSKGYELARASYDTTRINRLVLVSDGGANAGTTSLDLIAEQASDQDAEGIYLVGVGVGNPGTYHDTLMDEVTDAGKGASVFVDSTEEAWKMFAGRFVNTMGVAARNVSLQLDLPPGFEVEQFSGEGYSTDPREIDPQHIAPNDSMVFFNQLVTCAPELVGEDSAITVTVRYQDAVDRGAHETVLSSTWGELLAEPPRLLPKGRAIYQYAETLKVLVRERDPITREESLDAALARLAEAEALDPGDEDLAEIRAVLEVLDSHPAMPAPPSAAEMLRSLFEALR
jgi:Ca-activated chloride channel family protein